MSQNLMFSPSLNGNRLYAYARCLLLFFAAALLLPGGSYAGTGYSAASSQDERVVDHIRGTGIALSGKQDLGPLIERAGERRLVLLGEASHGTSEYYSWRAEISRRLIEDKGFDFVIVEADWPLAFRINRHVKHMEDDPQESRDALSVFSRWPQWMWNNEEVLHLVNWMRDYNSRQPAGGTAGFYGLDVYAWEQGISDVIAFLEQNDPQQVRRVRGLYGCFDRHRDLSGYLRSVQVSGEHCGGDLEEVHELLSRNRDTYAADDSLGFLKAYQNSRMVVFAERHIRGNLQQGPQSWNHRVDHFYDAAEKLLEAYGEEARGIVWAHNTHIGDARATDMRNAGMRNIGQIARETLGEEQVFSVGFGTYRGEVYAARQWEGRRERMQVPEARDGSYESLMYRAGISPLLLLFDDPDAHGPLLEQRGNRAIGVVYQPEQDARQNYVETVMPLRYDAFLFFDETRALTPLD
ncbi:erythromycin esterase family protein [Balneolales bacterium ANBcel1]|nr:erythromycin esterase family protein [Balneolales bacterium ANBcel1]